MGTVRQADCCGSWEPWMDQHEQPLFTLFVPTYNRLSLLPRMLESVEAQTFQDFELLIVDDGSQDDTYEFLCNYQPRGDYQLRVFYQENQGRHIAFNKAFEEARGILFTTINSDDVLAPNALARLAHWWQIASKQDEDIPIVGVEGLCASLDNHHVIGTPFPKSPMIADHIEIYYRKGVWGDAMRAVRTDIIRRYRFPQIGTERYIPPSYLWNRLGFDKYRILYFNEVLCYKEYRADGITKNRVRVRANSPQGVELYYRDFLELAYADGRVPARVLIRHTANLMRYSLYNRPFLQSLYTTYRVSKFPIWCIGALIGLALYLNDKRLLRNL